MRCWRAGAYVAQSFVAPSTAPRAPTAPSRAPAASGSHSAPGLGAGVAMGATALVAARTRKAKDVQGEAE